MTDFAATKTDLGKWSGKIYVRCQYVLLHQA